MKKPTSLRNKTIGLIISALILAVVFGYVFCRIFASRYFVNHEQKKMVELHDLMAETFSNEEYIFKSIDQIPNDEHRLNSINELIYFCEENAISLTIQNPASVVVFSYGSNALLNNRLNDIILSGNAESDVIKTGPGYTIQTTNGINGEPSYLELWGFLENGNSFVARTSYANIQNNINISLEFFMIIALTLIVIAAIVIFFLINYYSEPIRKLADLSSRVSEGDFESKYEYKHFRQDEIGILGENINAIGYKLEKTIADLKSANLNLENELKTKTELEEARKKYMSDVNHELKTPIALISSYAEGLKEGISDDPEDREYYCDVIIDEAEKMNLIVKRLSALNQLEEGRSAVSLERFNVVEVINGFLNTMSVIIEEKGVNIYFNNKDVAYVWSDEFLFEEVLVNYFNNALNHLDENKTIRINVEKLKDNVRVTVYNSGENIPEDEIPKLWGKFYKVDKARTREYGGSGLGLSIVKAICDSLNKKCGVYNMIDGVAFWVELESAATISTDEDITSTTRISFEEAGQEGVKPEKPETISRLKLSELPIWKKISNREPKDKKDK